jgi:hypothetical protein
MRASRIRKVVGYAGGREGHLSSLGMMLRWLGIAGFAFAVIASVADSKKDGASVLYLAFGISGLVQGFIADRLCAGLADVIRLLKKQNGLQYGGEILTPLPVYIECCSACGSEAQFWLDGGTPSLAEVCAKCGARFESKSE